MNKYLVVRESDGLVVNAISWDGTSAYFVEGCTVVPLPEQPSGVWIGWLWVNNEWVPPLQIGETE